MFLWYIYITLIGLCLVASLLRWQSLSAPVKVLSGLMLWTFIIELLRHMSSKRIDLLTHINLLVELVAHFTYFYILLNKKKRPYLYGGVSFFCIALFLKWLVHPTFFREKDYLDFVMLTLCLTVWCALFFNELIQKPIQHSLKLDGNFWINCGNILFYPGALLLFALSSYLAHTNPQLKESLVPINKFLNLVLYALYLVAFCADRRQAAGTEPKAE